MNIYRLTFFLITLTYLFSCNKKENRQIHKEVHATTIEAAPIEISAPKLEEMKTDTVRNQPSWAKDAVIYEVNVRQFSKEGTFAKVTEQLQRLKDMGVDVIWLMPIYPIGKKDRKGTLGSYYSIKNYKKVNSNFGTKQDLKTLVETAHSLGIKVLLDWVANHTSRDNVWIKQNLNFYQLDSTGKNPIYPKGTDWKDVAQLNYENPAMQDSMISAMGYWLKDFNIDGYRCDVAELVPLDFWKKARKELETIKPIFMLAEGTNPKLYEVFNMTYAEAFNDTITSIAEKRKNFNAISNYLNKKKENYKINHIKMYYTTNHDKNSWNYTEKEEFGDNVLNYITLSYAMGGMPLIYNGQESGLDKRLKFFEKDSINWGTYKNFNFYKNINQLLKSHPALWNNGKMANYEILQSNANTLQFIISKDDDMLVFLQNYSDKPIYVSKLSLNGFETNKNLLNNTPIPDDVRGIIEIAPHSTVIVGQ